MLTQLSTQEWLRGLLITLFQIVVVLAVLRGCWLIVRFNHRRR
ncbi:hypothetical protein Q5H93_02895 [Hymenobacter sp. ASUV-10]|uniref:Uncharacterized protein n=1 Tax=Hymenobacter aranciens TaxID=3063996 RepID=A0ABT9B5W6_9BACT|nr:hypothetical protein [Hymenobacter sp. ASUV-10]MDO7873666.1 hypothetical protein [Hymenobacter sp. ASUV-10]